MAGPQKSLINASQLEQVKDDFLRKGISVSGWARENNFPQGLVYSVLNGQVKGRRGKAYAIAVELGLIAPSVGLNQNNQTHEEN